MTSSYRPEIIQSAFVDFIGSHLSPFWSLTAPKLRLIARQALSDELIALQFEVNRAFKQRFFDTKKGQHSGWHGGQYINLKIPIEGIYHQRSYSLVGLPKQDLWWTESSKTTAKNKQRQTLTIAIKPQGEVSDYLTKHAAIGTIFDSSAPSGDFTLQQASSANQAPLLFIAGGSGITPMLGLITQALADKRQVTLVHYNRGAVLENYWQQLKNEHASFTYYLVDTQNPDSYLVGSRHLQAASLLTLDLPLPETQIFACGSQALLASLYKAVDEIAANSLGNLDSSKESSLRENIIIERFGTALSELALDTLDEQFDLATHTVYLRQRQQQFSSDSTLLLSAEEAGIRLNYGCRQGICQLCRCNKISGVVKNIQTGKLSGDGHDSIQTCINVAMSDVVLDI
ncbi:flavin reductase family protein [Psychrobacter sp. M13]|uniref:flavin reductase family protein n=1 Tax=Psychrobacter sp. M13 TaxID=3067275 RepID=UPI00273AF2EF|nr:2Fe-2S iron-sulfur cluster-binding protein [Psychrobacter sp. M13]WLP94700.1 2Fe-2S iron-sulfur cluster-binding protein [Psychrobacter sp. M13]